MEFDDRMRRAIERGHHRNERLANEERERQMTEEEVKRLHSKYRLEISDYIENCLQRLPSHFPGFQFETIYGDRGWGGACSRDDVRFSKGGRRDNAYSRLEITVRPFSSAQVIDLAGKGTISNKEVYNRNHYEKIADVDVSTFTELVDQWIFEYAEMYAVTM